jgi:DNA-binding NarL/FixJ family response regulator
MIKVVLADDHQLFRKGLRALLDESSDIHVIGEAQDGHSAIELIAEKNPDVVLMDIAMPNLNGLRACKEVTSTNKITKVIILSMHLEENYVTRALEFGASGYLLKDSDLSEVETAIRTVANGEPYLSPPISRHLIESFLRQKKETKNHSRNISDLTPRQVEVLRLIAKGHNSKEIGQLLSISSKTVDVHRRNIMEALNIFDIANLVVYAMRKGLI